MLQRKREALSDLEHSETGSLSECQQLIGEIKVLEEIIKKVRKLEEDNANKLQKLWSYDDTIIVTQEWRISCSWENGYKQAIEHILSFLET